MQAKDFLQGILPFFTKVKAVARDKAGRVFLYPEIPQPDKKYGTWVSNPPLYALWEDSQFGACSIEWDTDNWTQQIVTIDDLGIVDKFHGSPLAVLLGTNQKES